MREAYEGCWAAEKSQDKSEKSREEDYRRHKWVKNEDGDFKWKNQGAMKLCRRETNQLRESDGRRVTHAPSHATHVLAHGGQLPEKDTSVTAHGSSVVGVLASGG